MNSNIFTYAVSLVLVLAGAVFWSYTMQIDEAEKGRALARQELAAAEEGVRQARAWLAARREALALITASNIIEKQNNALLAEVQSHKNKRMEIARAFLSAIERGRQEMLDVEIPEIYLASGARLHKARLQSVDPDLAVILHSGGISKVATTLLPNVMLDRFRFGYLPAGIGSPIGSGAAANTAANSGSNSSTPAMASTANFGTSASDSLARLGMDANVAARNTQKKMTPRIARDPERVKVEGDPALWKSVERTSIGRAYIPGQGWLRIGADGPVPGSGRK